MPTNGIRQVTAPDARALVIAASNELAIDWRVADYAIWTSRVADAEPRRPAR